MEGRHAWLRRRSNATPDSGRGSAAPTDEEGGYPQHQYARRSEQYVVFSDEGGLVIARRWCWRQGEHSAAQLDTTNVIIVTEAHHEGARDDITSALQDLYELLTRYTEGQFKVGILDKNVTSITDDKTS
jgi:hypothetical protein